MSMDTVLDMYTIAFFSERNNMNLCNKGKCDIFGASREKGLSLSRIAHGHMA